MLELLGSLGDNVSNTPVATIAVAGAKTIDLATTAKTTWRNYGSCRFSPCASRLATALSRAEHSSILECARRLAASVIIVFDRILAPPHDLSAGSHL
jgi:hypothetical protein